MSDAPAEDGRKAGEKEEREKRETVARQSGPFPLLQAFAAGAETSPDGREVRAYRIQFALQIGLKAGREIELKIPRGVTGARLAQLLRQAANQVQAWVDHCDAIPGDQRDQAPKLSTASPQRITRCSTCDSEDAERHASCKRADCAMAVHRPGAVQPLVMSSAPPVQWCGPCSTAYMQQPGCPACAALAAQHARMFGPSADQPANGEAQKLH